jgi:hypothetical protein
MIAAPTQSFYALQAEGEAAELITSIFSPGAMGDIVGVSVLSKEFSNDIEPTNELDESIKMLKEGLSGSLQEVVNFNPLYIPMPLEALDNSLDSQGKGEELQFVAMNGNPFALKTVDIMNDEQQLIYATVGYHKFDLPGYEDILKQQHSTLLN